MAKEIPSVGDLRRKAISTDEEISAAEDAYLDNPKVNAFQFASGRALRLPQP